MEYVHIDSRDGRDWCLSLHVEYVHIDSKGCPGLVFEPSTAGTGV